MRRSHNLAAVTQHHTRGYEWKPNLTLTATAGEYHKTAIREQINVTVRGGAMHFDGRLRVMISKARANRIGKSCVSIEEGDHTSARDRSHRVAIADFDDARGHDGPRAAGVSPNDGLLHECQGALSASWADVDGTRRGGVPRRGARQRY